MHVNGYFDMRFFAIDKARKCMVYIGMAKCKHCSNEFLVTRKWQSFCSADCRNDYHNQRRRNERAKTHVRSAETSPRASSQAA